MRSMSLGSILTLCLFLTRLHLYLVLIFIASDRFLNQVF